MNSSILAALSDLAAGGSLVIYLLWLIVSLILAYVWIVLPFTISRKFDELLREARRQTSLLEKIERNSRKDDPAQPGQPARDSSVMYEAMREPPMAGGVVLAVIIIAALGGFIAWRLSQ